MQESRKLKKSDSLSIKISDYKKATLHDSQQIVVIIICMFVSFYLAQNILWGFLTLRTGSPTGMQLDMSVVFMISAKAAYSEMRAVWRENSEYLSHQVIRVA